MAVRLDVFHALRAGSRFAELRFDLDLAISKVKEKVARHTGTSSTGMKIALAIPGQSAKISLEGDDDFLTLRMFDCTDGCALYATNAADPGDTAAAAPVDIQVFEDSGVNKYVMEDEVYDKRDGTMRKFIQKIQLQQEPKQQQQHQEWTPEELAQAGYVVGRRCQLSGDRRGEVKYVGTRKKHKGIWIGVLLDEPLGSFGGLEGGVTYVETEGKYAEFAKPEDAKIGNYTPLDPLDLDEL